MSQYKVVDVIDDDYKIVINAGINKDVKIGRAHV